MSPASLREALTGLPGRLLDGMACAVAARGYAATTVADVIAAAGASRKTFYVHFENKQECFFATYDLAVEHAARAVTQAFAAPAPDWREQLRAGFRAFMAFVVSEPELARLCLVEVLATGPRGLERRGATIDRFARILGSAGTRAPSAVLPPRVLAEALVGGIESVISARLRIGRAHELPALEPELLYWALAPYVGLGEAAREYTGVS